MNRMPPRVSVIMAMHNAATTVEEAIGAIQRQTLTDWELLIVDDGSTDEGRRKVRALADQDKRLRLLERPHSGYASTMNTGWEAAVGEFVTCMDADDKCPPHRLEVQVRYLLENRDCDVCGTWMREFGIADGLHRRPADHDSIVAGALFETPLLHASAMVRREPAVRCGLRYRDDYPAAEDYDWWVRCMDHLRLACIQEVLYDYRRHADSVGRTQETQVRESSWRLQKELLLRLHLDPTPEEWALHRRVVEWRFARTHAEHRAIGHWLGRIVEANRTAGVYANTALTSVLAERWRPISRMMAVRGWDARTVYRQDPLCQDVHESSRARLTLILRCLMRKG